MRILGLDPGSRITGIGLIDWKESEPIHVHHGQIQFPERMSFAERLAELYLRLEKLFVEYNPQMVVIEKIFLGKNPDSVFKLGHVRAIGLLVAQQHGCQIAEYAARTVKKVVTGNGGAEKDHVRSIVVHLLKLDLPKSDSGVERSSSSATPLEETTNDATDALALAICHGYQYALADVARRLREMEL
jgi:crossover junction endodeoxyribonuclease RuvC